MAVSAMKFISVIGLTEDLESAAKVCGYSQCFQPDDVSGFYSDTKNFLPITTKNQYIVPLEHLRNVMDRAGFKRKIIPDNDFEPTCGELSAFSETVCDELGRLITEKKELEEQYNTCLTNIQDTSHFLGLNIELEKAFRCEYIKVNFGRLPIENYAKLDAYEDNPYVNFFPCTSDETYYWGVYISPVEKSAEIDRIFSGLYFEHYQIEGLTGTPDQYYKQQLELKPRLEASLDNVNTEIERYKTEHYDKIIQYYSKLEQLNAFSVIVSKACQYNNSFILVGWVPAEEEKQLKEKLTAIDSIEYTASDGKDELDHNPPVRLKNFLFAKPFEYYTAMYGLPCYNEIDPTKFIALTYIILFGIMFGDLGHGIVLLIASLFMWKKKKMPLGKIMIPCSVSSMIFGILFGSVFGFEEALNPMYKSLFGLIEKPIHVMEGNTATTIIFSAVGIGVLLVIVAMCLNIYSSFRRREFGAMLFGVNGFAGLIFYASLIGGLAAQLLLNITVLTTPYIIFLIVIPLVLIYLHEPLSKLIAGKKDWHPESWGGFLVENFFEMFEVLLSYITNTMSFLRVGAFVLVHAGMMQVVFALADMFGGGIGYILVLVFGNIFVIALEALLVGIQVLRLEYYELFSRFYKGEGREFEPVAVKETD